MTIAQKNDLKVIQKNFDNEKYNKEKINIIEVHFM